jgi:hypothetical protein
MRPEGRTAPWLVLPAALLLPGCAALPDHRDAGVKLGRFQALEADPACSTSPGRQTSPRGRPRIFRRSSSAG